MGLTCQLLLSIIGKIFQLVAMIYKARRTLFLKLVSISFNVRTVTLGDLYDQDQHFVIEGLSAEEM